MFISLLAGRPLLVTAVLGFSEVNVTVASLTGSVAAPGRNLAERDDGELLNLVHALPRGSETRSAACEVLVTRYQSLVRSCTRKYLSSPESADELKQVGYVGLMKAINRFDPAVGASLAPYAMACVSV